jgi:hypothetical protein
LIRAPKGGFRIQLKKASFRPLLKKNEEQNETTSHNYGFVTTLAEICSNFHDNVKQTEDFVKDKYLNRLMSFK